MPHEPTQPNQLTAQPTNQLTARWRGVNDTLLPPESAEDIAWSWLGAFVAICVVAIMNQYLT